MRNLLRYLAPPAIICFAASSLCAAGNPFLGKWKINPAKSKLTDEMKLESAGANKFVITFGPGQVDTIVADGTDQPALQGTTFSIAVEGPNNWKVVRKKDGKELLMAIWTLSADGKTLDDAFTGYQPDGSPVRSHFVYQRTAGSSGLAGTWDSVSVDVDSSIELEIHPYETDGLSFNSAGLPYARNILFDSKEHPLDVPNARPGATSSGRRLPHGTLEITNQFQGKITSRQQFELSPDSKTLTMRFFQADEKEPKNTFVFDRE